MKIFKLRPEPVRGDMKATVRPFMMWHAWALFCHLAFPWVVALLLIASTPADVSSQALGKPRPVAGARSHSAVPRHTLGFPPHRQPIALTLGGAAVTCREHSRARDAQRY